MKVPPRTALAALALLALGLTAVAGREPPRASPPRDAPQVDRATREALPRLELDKLSRARVEPPRGDPFAPLRPAAPPKRIEAPAPAAPAAPPVPWRYLGTLTDEGGTSVYLSRGEEPVLAAPGALLDGAFLVEAVAADTVTLRYVPLGTRHALPIPGRD